MIAVALRAPCLCGGPIFSEYQLRIGRTTSEQHLTSIYLIGMCTLWTIAVFIDNKFRLPLPNDYFLLAFCC